MIQTQHDHSLRADVRAYLVATYPRVQACAALHDSDQLLSAGLIDSMGIMQLVLWIEDAFNIIIEDDDLDPANFDSIDAICAFLVAKQAQQSS